MFNYIKNVKGELKHVSWPTRKQTIQFTAIVLGISVIVAIALGLFDLIFAEGLKFLIG